MTLFLIALLFSIGAYKLYTFINISEIEDFECGYGHDSIESELNESDVQK